MTTAYLAAEGLIDQLQEELHRAGIEVAHRHERLLVCEGPAVPAAQALLSDANPRRREDGSYILGHLKSDAGLEAHIALLNDSDVPVATQAAMSLGQICRREAPASRREVVRAGSPRQKTGAGWYRYDANRTALPIPKWSRSSSPPPEKPVPSGYP